MLEAKEKAQIREMICAMSMGRVTPQILKKFADMPDDVARAIIKNYHMERSAQIQKQIEKLTTDLASLK